MDCPSRLAVAPISRNSRGLDGVNFFVAAMQTSFGSFLTVYLVRNQWPPEAIGFALTISTLSSLFSQIPAGAVLDSIRDKRRAVLLGTVGVGLAALLLSVTVARPAVYLALAMQGLASSLISPGIAAISLVLAGQAALSERIGRNARFASIGNGLAAAAMGIAGSYLPTVPVFLMSAILAVPALLSLSVMVLSAFEPAPGAILGCGASRSSNFQDAENNGCSTHELKAPCSGRNMLAHTRSRAQEVPEFVVAAAKLSC